MKKQKIRIRFLIGLLVVLLLGCGRPDTGAEIEPETKEIEEITEQEHAIEQPAGEIEELPDEEETEESYDILPESFAYSLSIQINPLVELFFDAEHIVVGVAYRNEDAVDAYKELELVGASFEEGIELLVSAAIDKGYLQEDGIIDVQLEQMGTIESNVDQTILTKAADTINNYIQSLEQETPIHASVAIDVAKEISEERGIKAPSICTSCNGTGNSCAECGGTGDVRCKRCNGGIESCGTCGGSAIITCHGCHGAGKVGDAGESCNYCGGSGRMRCDACGGQGTFNCSWCGGALHHVCPECWGEGTCLTCGGDGYL